MSERPSFDSVFLRLAWLMSHRSTCRRLKVGAVVTSADHRRVYAVGYNGNASGLANDCDRHGEEAVGHCGCLHAEENAVINCDVARNLPKIVYVTHLPCAMCAKRITNLGGVRRLVYDADYRVRDSLDLLRLVGVEVARMPGFGEQ